MNNVSASALFTSMEDARVFAGLLCFEQDSFKDFLLSSTPTVINRMRTVLTQGRDQLASGDITRSVTRTIRRVDGLLSIFDISSN